MTQSDHEPSGETASEDAAVDDAGAVDEELPWPIGFMVIVGLAGLYLAWRLIQLIGRGLDWLF
jgi:hypothetical protein